jgi:polysaccharide biosynthesis PFTS motif protein
MFRLNRVFKARALRTRLNQMRGYRKLRMAGETDRVELIGIALAQTQVLPPTVRLSPLIRQGVDTPDETIVRQYLTHRLLRTFVFPEILRQIGSGTRSPFRAPIPKPWRQLLLREGIHVDNIACAVLWQGYLIAILGMSFLDCMRHLVRQRRQGSLDISGAGYFHALAVPQTPRASTHGPSRDLLTCISNRAFLPKNIAWLAHSAITSTELGPQELHDTACRLPVGRVLAPWSGANGLVVQAIVLAKTIGMGMAFIGWGLFGKWWNPLLLHEAMLLRLFHATPQWGRARAYFFHNSGWILRPLWTYGAELSGADVILYFYSSNVAGKDCHGRAFANNQWELCTWPQYWVWDKIMTQFILERTHARPDQLILTGPIEFADTPAPLPSFTLPSIALFDVQPVRLAIYAQIALAFDYYIPATSHAFLAQTTGAAQALGYACVLKRKRSHGRSVIDRSYLSQVDALIEAGQLFAVDPELAASRVIEQADAVISMPYTSTSVIAQSMGKPSCYFDPIGLLAKDDKDARGLPILHTQIELEEWLREVLDIAPEEAAGRGST